MISQTDTMKKIFFFLSALIVLASCSKPNDIARPGAAEQSMIEFKLDGSLKTYYDVNAGVDHITGTNVYSFVGTKAPTGTNIFMLSFVTDSLRAGTYNVNTGVVSFREAGVIATNVSSTDFTVTITSNVHGLINGSFSGTLYNHTTGQNSLVVQGRIENIQIIY